MPTPRRRRRWPWLLAMVLLLVLAGALMLSTEPPLPEPADPVNLPRRATREEHKRNEERRSWVPTVQPDGGRLEAPQRPRDPMMAALPPRVKQVAIVVEANAIRNSELGDLLVSCFLAGDDPNLLPTLLDAGLDPLTQIDRIAVADNTLIVTGDFSKTRWDALGGGAGMTHHDYGPKGELLDDNSVDGGPGMGVWSKQVLVFGPDQEAVKQVLDRLDGSGPQQGSVLSESQAWGEMYGVVQGDAISKLIGRSDPRLGDIVRETAKQVELHVDVSHDVGLVADVRGEDEAKSDELRKSIGSALSLARLRAQGQGKEDEQRLFELAHVRPTVGSGFQLEAGLPHDMLEKALKDCVEEKHAQRRERMKQRAVDAGEP